jgi:hypothetical protein
MHTAVHPQVHPRVIWLISCPAARGKADLVWPDDPMLIRVPDHLGAVPLDVIGLPESAAQFSPQQP